MGESQPHSVRSLAFRLVQRLMANKDGCAKILSVSCKPIVKSIISALGYSIKNNERVPDREMSLMFEACQLAMITRWPGKHHTYLWRSRVDQVLLDLLVYNFQNTHLNLQSLSVQELIAVTREGLSADFLLDLRPYVWEMIGWLSVHCEDDFHPKMHGKEPYLDVLITSACLSFADSIGRKRLIRQADRAYTFRSISAAKATLMMICSPSKYISSQARLVLFEILRLEGEEHLKHLIYFLNFVFFGDTSRMPDEFQMLINLMGLTCYSALPQFYRQVVSNGGVKALLAFVRWWLDNGLSVEKLSLTSHLQNASKDATCCRNDIEDWEGQEIHLLLAVWSLAEVIYHHKADGLEIDIFAGQALYGKEQFIKDMQDICISTRSSGLRSYCSYLLSFFGCYGLPSKLGKRIMLAFGEEDHCDMSFILRNGPSVNVHQVVLLARCPSLLPPRDPSDKEKTAESNGSSGRQFTDKCQRTKKEVILSAQVDEQAFLKLLDYIYSGYLQVEGDLIRKLKMLAKRCNMHPLLQLLCNKRPMWASSVLSFDLCHALGPAGHDFSDIILEAKSTEDTRWTCSYCYFSIPHVHAHRVILSSSCEYLRALFQSGMQESYSQTLKVPISWEALRKLVIWIYSNITPEPVSGCLWDNIDVEKKITELQPYIELCWLSEFWVLDDFQNECLRVITSFLDSPELSTKVIQLSADFSQWTLVDIAAKHIAPVYHTLRRSGALDILDEGLVEMIRVASVWLSQE